MGAKGPTKQMLREVRQARDAWNRGNGEPCLSEAYLEALRAFVKVQSPGVEADETWHALADDALRFLGGQGDRSPAKLAIYDYQRLGPFLGVSNEGAAAAEIVTAALRSPKALALGKHRNAVGVGIAVDAERLSSVGEVPAGPEDMSKVWRGCAGRILTTTNIGSRVNVRLYKSAPVIDFASDLAAAKAAIDAAILPFREACGGARPLQVSVRFSADTRDQSALLRDLVEYLQKNVGRRRRLYSLALHIDSPGPSEAVALVERGIATAEAAGVFLISIAGETSIIAGESISLPGLLGLIEPAALGGLISKARAAGISLAPANRIDPDAITHDIWSALNTARGFGLNMAKYGLFPLTLEQSDHVVGRIQAWFADWTAAPVFYVDQGLLTKEGFFAGERSYRA